jgi:D-3-phosphoglycerate dehydrogenase
MYNVKLLNKIAAVGTDVLDKSKYAIGTDIENPDAILVRSTVIPEESLNSELRAIARAGAGVNNICVDACAEKGVVVFNTPGANANGVKELAIAALILASRDVVGGVEWVKTLEGTEGIAKAVEAGKSKFAGREIKGKTLGVIGLGAIGGLVANAASSLGMRVVGCDPYMTVNAAWHISRAVESAATYDDVFKTADYITLHVPATPATKKMINKDTLAMMKDGVRIVNLARADLVDAEAMKEALASGKVASYVTDFPNEETVGVKGIVNIPHLGASTEESEDNCAVMAAEELVDFLENGNIRNSVNYPAVSMPRTTDTRICVLHRNVPAMISKITEAFANEHINIEHMSNGSKGDFAYTMLDINGKISGAALDSIKCVDGIIRVNVIE